jgi:hypothetical protein
MVLSQSAVPVALIPQVVSSTPAGLTGAGEAAHCRDSPYLGRAAELLQVAERPGGQSPAAARVFRTKPDCVRNSRLGHPVHIFAEKQSHQVIENTELRPKIGQNKPNFGHFREGDSKPRAGQVQQSPWYEGTRISTRTFDAALSASVALPAAGIEDLLITPSDELKVVTVRVQGQLEDAKHSLFLMFAIVIANEVSFLHFPARTDHKFPNAPSGIELAICVLRGEPFVIMFVTREDHIGVEVVKRLPDRLHLRATSVPAAVVEEGVMPVGYGAGRRKSFQVFTKPFLLLGTLVAGWGAVPEEPRVRAFAVDHDNVPRAEVVAVIPLLEVPTRNLPRPVLPRLSPVLEETRRPVGDVLVITDSGAGPIPQRRPAPGLVIATEGLVAAAKVGKVAGGKDSSGWISFQDFGGCLGALRVPAVVNVARSDENLGRLGVGCRPQRGRNDGGACCNCTERQKNRSQQTWKVSRPMWPRR